MAQACNPGTQRVETGRAELRIILNCFLASLVYIRLLQKQKSPHLEVGVPCCAGRRGCLAADRQTVDQFLSLPFSSARPSRRQPCWSCCMSSTTSWPSRQVSSQAGRPGRLSHHADTAFPALWGFRTGLAPASQTLLFVYTNMGLLAGMGFCPIMLWGLVFVCRKAPGGL